MAVSRASSSHESKLLRLIFYVIVDLITVPQTSTSYASRESMAGDFWSFLSSPGPWILGLAKNVAKSLPLCRIFAVV